MKSEISQEQLAELSALADGSLDPARRPKVEGAIAASPELSALYERERRAVQTLHRAREEDRAPAALRARIEAQRPAPRVRARRRAAYGGAFATVLAGVVIALALILPAGTPGAPSVSQAAALALRGPGAPAPGPDPQDPARLGRNVQDVYFPDWSGKVGGWRAIGQRTDKIGGHTAATVYYAWRGKQIAYTIVSAPALTLPTAQTTQLNGTELRTLTLSGRDVVTWRRANNTCVLSAQGVPVSVLLHLAAWRVPGESG